MNENEHMFDDRPLTQERVASLKASAEELLREYEALEESQDKTNLASA